VLDEASIALLGRREELAASEELFLGLWTLVHRRRRGLGLVRAQKAPEGRDQENADEVPRAHDLG
jgi:hypothetical protein